MEVTGRSGWSVRAEPVDRVPATSLLREYFTEMVGRYYRRPADPAEIDAAMVEAPSDDLTFPDGLFLLARYLGEPGGCVGLRLRTTPFAEITRLFVRPEVRGRGGGARLLAEVEAAATAYGATALRLDTREDLIEARSLYAKHGFREIPPYSDAPYADHWFEKRLG